MKRRKISLFFALAVLLLWSCKAQQPQKAVFIICDGIPADVVERVQTPAIDELSKEGGFTRAFVGGDKGTYTESPTISAVGYNHLLTGTWSYKHNVWGNDITAPNYHYWNLFRIVEQDPSRKTAVFSTWLANRTKLIGDGLAAAGGIRVDYAYDGFENDTVRFPHDNDGQYIHQIDELVSKEAARYIESEGPDLSWVYLEFTDDMGHRYGDSPQLDEAVKMADAQVGRILEAVKNRESKTGERWMIVVTTDHGRNAETGRDHGGQSARERTTWITTNRPPNAHFSEQPGIVDIMPSILNFMNIPIPDEVKAELDAVPFIGPVSISRLEAEKKGNVISLSWNVLDPKGEATIYVSTTNNFANGGADKYVAMGRVAVSEGRYNFDVQSTSSDFYKILVKTPGNWENRWIGGKAISHQ